MKAVVVFTWYEELNGVMETHSKLVLELENKAKVDADILSALGVQFEEHDVFEISVKKVARRVTETKDVPVEEP